MKEKELEAKSFFSRIVRGLGVGCAALSVSACSGDDMPVPGGTDQPTGDDGDTCGGIVGLRCPSGKYCDFEGTCGLGDVLGTCRTIPTSCEEECGTKVCGCDGLTYCNDCTAHLAGVDDALDMTTCQEIPPTPPPTLN